MARLVSLPLLLTIACATPAPECPDGYSLNKDDLCVEDAGTPEAPSDDFVDEPVVDDEDPDSDDPPVVTEPEPEPEPEPTVYDVVGGQFVVDERTFDGIVFESDPIGFQGVGELTFGFNLSGNTIAGLDVNSVLTERAQGWTHTVDGAEEGGLLASYVQVDLDAVLAYDLGFFSGSIDLAPFLAGGSDTFILPVDGTIFEPLLLEGGTPDIAGFYSTLAGAQFGPVTVDVGTDITIGADLDIALTTLLWGTEVEIDHGSHSETMGSMTTEHELLPIGLPVGDEPGSVDIAARYHGVVVNTLTVDLWPTISVPSFGINLAIPAVELIGLDEDTRGVTSDWALFEHTAL